MSRPEGSSSTIDAIRIATLESLCADGFEKASMRGIAKRAGLAPSTLYHYFADRNQVVAYCANHYVENLKGLIANLGRAIEMAEKMPEAVDALISDSLRFCLTHRKEVQLANHLTLSGRVHDSYNGVILLPEAQELADRFAKKFGINAMRVKCALQMIGGLLGQIVLAPDAILSEMTGHEGIQGRLLAARHVSTMITGLLETPELASGEVAAIDTFSSIPQAS